MLACRRTRNPTQRIMINECYCQKYSVIVKYHSLISIIEVEMLLNLINACSKKGES
jgi:hypothetical protein